MAPIGFQRRQILTWVTAVLGIFVLQAGAVYLDLAFDRQIRHLDWGLKTLSFALFATILGLTSGVILALLLFPKSQEHSGRGVLWKALILGAFPALAVLLKLAFATGVVPFSPLRPVLLEVWEWATRSQAPPFWLGVVVGWLITRTTA